MKAVTNKAEMDFSRVTATIEAQQSANVATLYPQMESVIPSKDKN